MFPIFSLRDNRFTKYIVHIPGTLSDYISQLLRYIHINPMAKLPIKERAVWYMDEGGNLAASKIRNLECPNYEICLIDYGCGKFNRKIHIMEQYP